MTWSPVDLLAGSQTTVPVLGNPPEHCCTWVICLFRCCQASECVVLGASCKRCSSKGFAWICNAWIRHGPTSTQRKAAFLFCRPHCSEPAPVGSCHCPEEQGGRGSNPWGNFNGILWNELWQPRSTQLLWTCLWACSWPFRGDVSPLVELAADARNSRCAW